MQLDRQNRHESKKLRDSAQGQECTVRLPGICNHNPETTVLAHLPGAGMGTKHSDLLAAFACSSCHDVIDGRVPFRGLTGETVALAHYEGIFRTQQYWMDRGLVKLL